MYKNNNEMEKKILEVLKSIEVPESRYEKAIDSYKSVGEWLNRDNSILKEYKPKVYCQGSFRLGTAIKPISTDDEYDVDIVCELDLSKNSITQKKLKEMVGLELDKYTKSRKMKNDIAEGKRCWTLNYSDEVKFHIDVLPCIPNGNQLRSLLETSEYRVDFSETAIDITDNTLTNYNIIHHEWNCSNPVGYHNWFKEQMKVVYLEKRDLLMESYNQYSVEEIPEYKIKTPLQQVIQLLKRHRDVMFEDYDSDNKPISIIISTLAAKAYNNESNLVEAFYKIINNMQNYLENKDGIYWVANPVNPLENFADKWESNPERKEGFFKWIKQLKSDYSDISSNTYNEYEKRDIYEGMFGKSMSISGGLIVQNVSENYLNHRQEPTWYMNNIEECKIVAYKSRKGYRRANFASGEPLLKRTQLRFEVKSNSNANYKTFWRITNTGHEASAANCLRGDFYNGSIIKGKKVREETALYKGVHTVECFMVSGNICIAKSEPFIVNII